MPEPSPTASPHRPHAATPPAKAPPGGRDPRVTALIDRYWRANLTIMLVLLAIWAAAGLGCGILFADVLNQYTLPGTGFPLGFWFAQQGSIIVFVLLILVYCILLNRLDRRHHRQVAALNMRDGGAR